MTADPHHPVITSRAEVPTDTPDRFAKQLIAHLGRKLDFSTDGATSTATIGEATGQIVVGDGQLTLVATGVNEEAVARVEHVLGSHLERFGQRNELTVTWTRATTAPAEQTDTTVPDTSRPAVHHLEERAHARSLVRAAGPGGRRPADRRAPRPTAGTR